MAVYTGLEERYDAGERRGDGLSLGRPGRFLGIASPDICTPAKSKRPLCDAAASAFVSRSIYAAASKRPFLFHKIKKLAAQSLWRSIAILLYGRPAFCDQLCFGVALDPNARRIRAVGDAGAAASRREVAFGMAAFEQDDIGLAGFLTNLHEADDIQSVWRVLTAQLAQLDFEYAIYLNISSNESDAAPLALSNLPSWWTDYYLSPERASEDPFLHLCRSYEFKLTGPSFLERHPYLNDRERQFVLEAGETGMRSGFAAPFGLVGQRTVGGWNLGASAGAASFDKLRRENGERASIYCMYAHLRLAALQGGAVQTADPPALTRREKECLTRLARGYRTAKIAADLRISAPTVEFHLKNARQKLNAATREQAVALAVHRSLVQPFA